MKLFYKSQSNIGSLNNCPLKKWKWCSSLSAETRRNTIGKTLSHVQWKKKAIPLLWFLCCFFLWNCGPSLEYRSKARALIWKILHGGGRTWETITLRGFLFHPLGSVIWRYALVCNFSSPQLPTWPPSYATLFPPLSEVGFCLGRHMK